MEKLEEQELQQVHKYQTELREVIFSLGQLESDIVRATRDKESVIKTYLSLVTKQNELLTTLNKKYGDIQVDIQTGEITKEKVL